MHIDGLHILSVLIRHARAGFCRSRTVQPSNQAHDASEMPRPYPARRSQRYRTVYNVQYMYSESKTVLIYMHLLSDENIQLKLHCIVRVVRRAD